MGSDYRAIFRNGSLPLNWSFVKIEEVSSLVTNGFVGTASPFYTDDSGIIYLYGNNIEKNRIKINNLRYITPVFHKKQRKTTLKTGDLLTVQSGHIGETAVVGAELDGANCHALIVTRPVSSKINSYFLSQYLNAPIGFNRLKALRVGSTIEHINTKDFKKFRIPLPPLPEQKKIAAVLSTWDEAIEGTERLLANSRQQKKALTQQLLTGRVRLPGFEGAWKFIRLKEMISERKQRNKHLFSEVVLSVTNKGGFKNPEEYFSKRVASSDLSGYKIVRDGDFAYNPSRLNVGSFARLKSHGVFVVSPIYVVFSIDDSCLDGDFFDFWMHTHYANQQILNSTQGSVRNSVSFESLAAFKLDLPPLPEQKAIAAVLTTADDEIAALEKDLARLRAEKKALMQQLLTGKRRMKVT